MLVFLALAGTELSASALQHQADSDYLQEQILLQEQRISQLHEQLMQHQMSREQRRQGAARAPTRTTTAAAQNVERGGSRLYSDTDADLRKLNSQGSQRLHRHASGSTKGSSRQVSDELNKVRKTNLHFHT